MFGSRWWGRRWFGQSWFGDGSVSDVDFGEWLAAPNRRCVLAEFSAVGYDADSSPVGTKTVNVYISNMGYTTRPTDDPPNQHYNAWITKIPTFRREMSTALSGKATAGFGSLVVSNPAQVLNGPGIRDDWLRMRWKRDYVTLYLGDPTWAKNDFRVILKGRLGQPTAPSDREISFPLSDLADLFNNILQTDKFPSGPYLDSYMPLVLGWPQWCDLPVLDQENLIYQMSSEGLEDWADGYPGPFYNEDLYDGGSRIGSWNIEGIADPTADTFELLGSPATHGFVNDSMFALTGGVPPGGLNLYQRYYVVNVTADTWQVSDTIGGAPKDITSPGSSVTFTILPYQIDYDAGTVTLLTQPASSRITAFSLLQRADSITSPGSQLDAASPAAMLDYVIFTKGAIDTSLKDQATFDSLAAEFSVVDGDVAGVYVNDRSPTTIGAVVEKITRGTSTWYGVTPEGKIQVGLLDLPSDTSVMDLTASDVKGVRQINTIRPIDFNESSFSYHPSHLTDGPLLLNYDPVGYSVPERYYQSTYTYSTDPTPIDNRPGLTEAKNPTTIESIYINPSSPKAIHHVAQLYQKVLGVFEFQAPLSAIWTPTGGLLTIGQTISLTHPRLGWKVYAAGEVSPDNPDEFDATKAVVIGVDVNLSGDDPFPVRLTVFRQIPGYYPTADLN